MSIIRQTRINYWHWLMYSCCLLPICIHSTPIPNTQDGRRTEYGSKPFNCAHESIAELIKTSPVILKALGARVFTDSDISAEEWWQSGRPLKSEILTGKTAGVAKHISVGKFATAESILITLTPETIYKGTSLLKMMRSTEGSAHDSESTFQYEGQLNATLEPLTCFDNNVLKMLPTELIAFGKLVTVQEQQQQPKLERQNVDDLLRISINGLHRWSSQFENHIWKHLGWDDWSDFTLCSVACGKGVQQRFRRCLLDNPLMNLNMNLHLNADDEQEDGEVLDDQADDVDALVVAKDQVHASDELKSVRYSRFSKNDAVTNENEDEQSHLESESASASESDEANNKLSSWKSPSLLPATSTEHVVVAARHQQHSRRKQRPKNAKRFQLKTYDIMDYDDELMQTVEGIKYMDQLPATATPSDVAASSIRDYNRLNVANTFRDHANKQKHRLRKNKKSAKTLSTMFCEGYNIEQRNCNTFECSDDISDLLKYYKKLPIFEDASTTSFTTSQQITDESHTVSPMAITLPTTSQITATFKLSPSVPTTTGSLSGTTGAVQPSSTPANMGYISNWHNNQNFTIMITLRVKNDTKPTATIFSIRNSSHNLYLEPSSEGLHLYLERDKTTEMLPVKFNLYDYRWHDISISIQNGDFISMYVDCSWTNSFVVSKRLFSLPVDADVEIGRGFNGELQQLLVLPDNQERHQCSNIRTSINEVKRYIIDTFIDDYGN